MDPSREAKLKEAAEALAHHVYGALKSLEVFHVGLRMVEQSRFRASTFLPAMFFTHPLTEFLQTDDHPKQTPTSNSTPNTCICSVWAIAYSFFYLS